MFGSEVLDVAIGLIFVFILVSIICSAIREGIEAWMKTRAVYLEHGIRQLLQDNAGTGLAKDVLQHPLIFGLFSAGTYEPGANTKRPSIFTRGADRPSYIPSSNFAKALMDIAARGPSVDAEMTSQHMRIVSIENIRKNVANIQSPGVRRVLMTALDSAQGDLDKLQANLEGWYDSAMDRVSGWYKRSTHAMIFVIGLVVAVTMNVDTLAIVEHLYVNQAARALAVAAAESASPDMSYDNAKAALAELKLPIGWTSWRLSFRWPQDLFWKEWFGPWLGWFLTALAASLGAPFWFDILNKFMVIRSTVKPREKSGEEGSEDRQLRSAPPAPVQPVAPPATVVAQPPAALLEAAPAENEVDGCSVDFTSVPPTSDEQLPAAEGGVA